jgi:predicted nucleotidyltransferase
MRIFFSCFYTRAILDFLSDLPYYFYMRTLEEIKVLKKNEKEALSELKSQLKQRIPDAEIILYGSKARGDSEELSDIDLLILIDKKVDRKLKEKIVDIRYDIELKYDVVFGLVIENKNFWDSSLANAMPFHKNVEREGILL